MKEDKKRKKQIDDTLRQAEVLLKIIDNNNKMLDNLNQTLDKLSDFSKLVTDLPPSPEVKAPPVSDPEEVKNFFKLVDDIREMLKERNA